MLRVNTILKDIKFYRHFVFLDMFPPHTTTFECTLKRRANVTVR